MANRLVARILCLEEQHGGLRAAARVVGIDPGYLKRLRDSEKTSPSEKTLRKLGLVRIISYAGAEDERSGNG